MRAELGLDLSVVICAYTPARWVLLQRAVASVVRQDPPPTELLVVVDNNAELYELARRRWPAATAGPGCATRVVPSEGGAGLSAARNTGTRAASASIVAFLDDDAEAQAGWAQTLVVAYEDPAVVACGGLATAHLTGSRPGWWPAEFDWVVGCSYVGLPTARADVRNVIGANMSMRRSALIALDGFAEGIGRVGALPFGCEETDLCIRLHQRWPSARIVHEPAAGVLHAVPAERLSWRYFRARCFAEGVSKAKVAARVGTRSALSSERSYVARVLPRGVGRGLLDACRGDRGALRRAAAIIAGLTMTSAGYVSGRLAA